MQRVGVVGFTRGTNIILVSIHTESECTCYLVLIKAWKKASPFRDEQFEIDVNILSERMLC